MQQILYSGILIAQEIRHVRCSCKQAYPHYQHNGGHQIAQRRKHLSGLRRIRYGCRTDSRKKAWLMGVYNTKHKARIMRSAEL